MANDTKKTDTPTRGMVPPHLLQYILEKSLCAPAPHPMIKRRRDAEALLLKLSQGEMVLCSQGYSGDDQRHRIVHTVCGHAFLASIEEVQRVGGSRICPYCNIADDLTRIGTMEQIQHYVIAASESRAYFYASNDIGSPAALYDFLCLVHKKPFRAAFSEFQRLQGRTNGCPMCQTEIGLRRSDRAGGAPPAAENASQ